MIDELKTIGTHPTITAAINLELAFATNTPFSLHLRDAKLNSSDAKTLAVALKEYVPIGNQVLNSFSVSHNASIGDLGTIALLKALPYTVKKIGFNSCAIGDEGGLALLEWVKNAPNLRIMCVENNNFSNAIKYQIRKLVFPKKGLVVIV